MKRSAPGHARRKATWPRVAWLAVVVGALLAGSWLLGVSGSAAVAVSQDGLPVWLFVAWPIAGMAALTRRWPLAGAAGVLAGLHVALLASAILGSKAPDWVSTAPRLTIAVANVYVDNREPGAAAAAIVAADADVIVIVESNDAFLAAFDAAGGAGVYPFRVSGGVQPDYLVSIVSRLPFGTATVDDAAILPAPEATIACGTAVLEIVGVNPFAAVDPGGFEQWQQQLAALAVLADGASGPFVIAGDLNTTQFRPDFEELLDAGLRDAHTALGSGLDPSFKLSADGPLSSLGTIARLDRLLFNPLTWPVSLEDLEVPGSDHEGFVAEIAVRADGPCT